jgi:hypothetical protein
MVLNFEIYPHERNFPIVISLNTETLVEWTKKVGSDCEPVYSNKPEYLQTILVCDVF